MTRKIGSLDSRLLIEATIVGLMLVVVCSILHLVTGNTSIYTIFIGGMLVHLGCEFTGINQYYVDYYKSP